MLFMEAQSSVKQGVRMLISQRLSLYQVKEASADLTMPADALSDAFGSDHSIMHAVGQKSCLEGNLDS